MPSNWIKQANRRKRAQTKAQEIETHLFPYSGISQKRYSGSHNISTKDVL